MDRRPSVSVAQPSVTVSLLTGGRSLDRDASTAVVIPLVEIIQTFAGLCYRTTFAGLVSAIGSLTRNSVRLGCDSKSIMPSL
jgi:hypothetical protein